MADAQAEVNVAAKESGDGWTIVGSVVAVMIGCAIFSDWAAEKPLYTSLVDFAQFVFGKVAEAVRTILR